MNKLDQIREVVKTINQINRDNVEQVVKLQDLLNINGAEVYELWKSLNREERRKLLWIISSISGYDTFEFYLQHGVHRVIIEKLEDSIEKEHAQEYEEILKRKNELNDREYALDLRESELKNRERILAVEKENLEVKVQREQGKKITILRQQLSKANRELKQEKEFTSKTRAFLTRLKAI